MLNAANSGMPTVSPNDSRQRPARAARPIGGSSLVMRRGLLSFVTAVMMAGVGVPWERAARAEDGGVLRAVRARGEMRVCIWPDYFAISYRNPRNRELEGIDIDLARDFARSLGVRATFVETNFRDFMERLQSGDCDVAMFGVGITAQRAERVAFSEPYLSSAVYAVTTRDSRIIRSWEDIDQPGNVIGVAAGTFMEPLMRDALRRATLEVIAPPRSREAELQAGRIDAFMSDYPYTRRMVLMHDWVRVIDPPGRFGETRYAYAVAKGDAAWLAEVNRFVATARSDGTLARAAARHDLTPIVAR